MSPVLSAAPRLSLAQTALSISVAPGSDGPAQNVESANIGDGSLNLQASSSVPWLVPNIGDPESCALRGICIPVQIAVPSSPLAAGRYTGTVTVFDPNAVDSPQFIVVTLLVGGSVPDNLEYFLQPGSSASSNFATGSRVLTTIANNSPWLSVALNGMGSFSFNVPYQVTVTADPAMATGDYKDTINVSGSIFAPDNKPISVVLHVTTLPILQATPAALNVNIAQGANAQSSTTGALPFINTLNNGQGTLGITSVTAATTDGATWLNAALVNGSTTQVSISVDPTGLSPGAYQGTITLASNAANSSVKVPVQFTVETPAAPVAFAGSVADTASFTAGNPVAQGELVAISGDQFTYGDPQQATPPFDVTLANTQVLVNGQPAPISSVFPSQIIFQVPFEAATGDGTVQVVSNGQNGNLIDINVTNAAPRFLLLNGGPYVTIAASDGSSAGNPNNPVAVGDTVVISAIGLGATSPPVADGAPGPPDFSAMAPDTQVCFGQHSPFSQPICTDAGSPVLAPAMVGIYLITVQIPDGVPSGSGPFFLTLGAASSEMEQIAVQ